jgi:xanthine dehydrogenase large subunit
MRVTPASLEDGLEPTLTDCTLSGTVGQSFAHESAHLHVTGSARYLDDLPELAGTLHAAVGLSPIAHGRLVSINLPALQRMPGVVAVLLAADIPGVNNVGPLAQDDPALAEGTVHYVGQPGYLVIAISRDQARRAAARAAEVLNIEALPAVFCPRVAHTQGRYICAPMHLRRESGPGGVRTAIDRAPHVLNGRFSLGGQEHFYLEGQIAYAMPVEDGGVRVHCSTQHPSEMQATIAHTLGIAANQVLVEVRRMGGGFGGKESQSALFAVLAAVAAARVQRPVKLRVDRDDDFLMTGRRHPFEIDYEVGYDDTGRVLGVEVSLIGNAGFSTDLSPPVMTRAICHFDNAYWLPEVAIHGYLVQTNLQSNTAFRGFGGPQGALAIEVILDEISRALGRDPLDVRLVNLYGTQDRNVTPYGQRITDNIEAGLLEELLRTSDYQARRRSVERFNAQSEVLRKGLALTPVKFGISFNLAHLNQAGALVHIYIDGSILVNHGGTEMGQGLNTKVTQVVAHELGVPMHWVRSTATDTSKVANTSATAASTGSDLNCKAAQAAARTIRDRLADCFAQKHDFPASQVVFVDGQVRGGGHEMRFEALIALAYTQRIQLWSDGFYATPGLHWDRATMTGRPFHYFSYGASVSEVVIDMLTGEWKLLRADLLQDVGQSLNPAIDLGQVEGAFVQGMGWLTSEELVWHPQTGALLTHAPSTYKIPTANDALADLRVALFENCNVEDSIHRSKAVGEPPLLLAFSVFLAIRDAISAVGGHKTQPPLRAPATPEAILAAINAVQVVPII